MTDPTPNGDAAPPENRRALLVTAHPDDVDFGAAGTVATWVDEGWTVTYCICTDGDAGGFDPAVPRSEIGGIRRAEQSAAAAELGVTDVRFLGYADGALEVTPALVRDIARVIRDVRPQRVVMPSPERDWTRIARSHPDHLAAGEATIRAIYPAARNPFAFPELLADEGLEAWTVPETWVSGHPHPPDTFVDITDTFSRKIAALRPAREPDRSHDRARADAPRLVDPDGAAGRPSGRPPRRGLQRLPDRLTPAAFGCGVGESAIGLQRPLSGRASVSGGCSGFASHARPQRRWRGSPRQVRMLSPWKQQRRRLIGGFVAPESQQSAVVAA